MLSEIEEGMIARLQLKKALVLHKKSYPFHCNRRYTWIQICKCVGRNRWDSMSAGVDEYDLFVFYLFVYLINQLFIWNWGRARDWENLWSALSLLKGPQ